MKLRNNFIFSLVIVLILAFAGTGLAEDKVKVIMVTDTAELGDKSFNDSVWAGIEKAKKDLGIKQKSSNLEKWLIIFLTSPGQSKTVQIL